MFTKYYFKHIRANFLEEGGVESFLWTCNACISMNIQGIRQAHMRLIHPHSLLSLSTTLSSALLIMVRITITAFVHL